MIREPFSYKIFFTRLGIVFFYLIVFALFLNLGRVGRYFFPEKNVVTLYTFREVFPESVLKEFEGKTGISVHVSYYETNEELFAKFKVNQGEGYDLVVPSDYMVELLVNENFLQPIDHSKITQLTFLDKRLLNKYFDPENKYSLPINWIPFGIGFNKNILSLPDDVSWDIVFKQDVVKNYGINKISMLNDAREALFLGAIYLFGQVDNVTEDQVDKVRKLLIQQKHFVESYSESGAKFLLLSEIVPLAVLPAARMKEVYDVGDFGFVIPREGSLIEIENLVIPKRSQKTELVYKLINFLLSKRVGAISFNVYGCNPANVNSYALLDKKYRENRSFFPGDAMFDQLYIIHNKIPMSVVEKNWFLIKSQ